ncbi:excinuclease ABC subunit A [Pseudosulfitobacter pseudonitzschiae]|uniref:excinuclease ABC subunit A n=2 Tax=Pseudosulfitobacter pseudonitzschiae TaxID=1402135 RepID=UPI001CCC4126|nr:excinuclease ABC subunit A [Pseudosulfitobacter pseudonitzschiae]MCA0134473.1 excinuclease ABC subunit A [Pseudosulfitobacter pseudonitzschiae]MCD2325897.1 excinuclease ABC subunit A [Pseudosulfitobacter pseudonitzschiae]MCD2350483.1 excinuclease ABC subunit A [Pseudosulfitobacter pseudonitzschiae]MCI2215902.1 excinuclease ABC subunit A [Pseudosulfitobacter pseudonitzschiae]UFE28890.1 excinuclease ABC subunit A [Pseudosulfitobacter pseudonitzschiae]
MRRLMVLFAVAVASVGVTAEAGSHKTGKEHSGGAYKTINCPPGLAKKNPPCVPPGQARKYNRGDVINGDYIIIRDPGRYGLDRGQTYYRVGDYVYRVDRDTREVLDLIGAVARILN